MENRQEQQYTVRQIAEMLGVSKQAVHQKRRKEPLATSLQQFTSTVDGVVYITESGVELIKNAFSGSTQRQQVDGNKTVNEATTTTSRVDGVDALESVIDTLKQQLTAKDEQIKTLNEQLAQALKVADQAQQLQAASEQKLRLLEDQQPEQEQPKRRRWFWNRKDSQE